MARRFPVLTGYAVGIAGVAAILQYTVPGIVPALQRDPDALAYGQWWRLVTPLLVQTLGWYQVLVNLVTLALVGAVAEWVLGRWRWLLLFLTGTAAGQLAAYAWQEPGGGDSIAICGLAGGVALALLAGSEPVPRIPAYTVVLYIAALAGWGWYGVVAAGLACLATIALWYALRWLPHIDRLALAGTVACALVLALRRDLHGISLTAGIVAMTVLVLVDHRLSGLTRDGHTRLYYLL